jgi:hypothetical protein
MEQPDGVRHQVDVTAVASLGVPETATAEADAYRRRERRIFGLTARGGAGEASPYPSPVATGRSRAWLYCDQEPG